MGYFELLGDVPLTRSTQFLGLVSLLTFLFVAYYFLSGMATDNASKSTDNFGCALMLFVPFLIYIAVRGVLF
jgi:hypothetical protein